MTSNFEKLIIESVCALFLKELSLFVSKFNGLI